LKSCSQKASLRGNACARL